jgi:hypothetical protein
VTGVGDEVMARSMASSSAEWWRPTRTLATWLTWLFAAQAAGQVALMFVDNAKPLVRMHAAFDALFDGRDAAARRLFRQASEGNSRPGVQVIGYVALASVVLLLIWLWRSAHNAQALGRTGARLTPVWAVLGWIIPLASFVLPYLAISDLWRSSDPQAARGDGWRSRPVSPLVVGWWIFFLGTLASGIAAVGLPIAGKTDLSETETLLQVSHLVAAVSATLTIVVIRTITQRQEAQQMTDPAPTSRPQDRQWVVPTNGDGPGWYADPGRRYDHRYWDGTAWTEHVSTAGEASIAPVVPPDWYPDPTGRFHWRYWTGHEWTEHVSRDQELFVDPVAAGEVP